MQFGDHGYKPYLRSKNQADLKTAWICGAKGLPDLKLRHFWWVVEPARGTEHKEEGRSGCKSSGVTMQKEEMIQTAIYPQIFKNALLSFNLRSL